MTREQFIAQFPNHKESDYCYIMGITPCIDHYNYEFGFIVYRLLEKIALQMPNGQWWIS